MSFGFSAGDFIAAGTLIADIIGNLREAGGAKSEYQEILRELEGLQHALAYLDKLESRSTSATNIDSIKYAALSCRRPLEQFLEKIKKYKKTLGIWSKAGSLKSAADKLKWSYTQNDEIRKLQTYLNVHVGTINILLAEHGLERMDIASARNETDQLQVRERLDDTRRIIEQVNDSSQSQSRAIAVNDSMLVKLMQMVGGDVMASLKSIAGMVSKVCISTQQIYTVVLQIKSSINAVDTRWAYFQAPVIVEDALGRKFPVPSEYDFALLDVIIKHRFIEGPAALNVSLGNYEVFDAKNSSEVIMPNARLLPGSSITMAILVDRPESFYQNQTKVFGVGNTSTQTCPMPTCSSIRTTASHNGGRYCDECGVYFTQSRKKMNSFQDILDGIDHLNGGAVMSQKRKRTIENLPENSKRLKGWDPRENMRQFRNVRWTNHWNDWRSKAKSSAANPDDDWTKTADMAERRRISNRVAQRNYRKKLKRRLEDLDKRASSSSGSIDRGKTNPSETETPKNRDFVRLAPDVAPTPRPILTDALGYLDEVEVRFVGRPDIYDMFLDVMKAYKLGVLNTPGVAAHVKYLFKGYHNLLRAFAQFLPPGNPQYDFDMESPCDPNFVWMVTKELIEKSEADKTDANHGS